LHRRLQYSPCMGSTATSSPRGWACWGPGFAPRTGPPWPVQLRFHCASGMTLGTPKCSRRIWRNQSSGGTCAAVVGTDWTTTPEFAHEEERTRAARILLCCCSLSRIPRNVRECRMRSAAVALSVAALLATGRLLGAVVSGSPLMVSVVHQPRRCLVCSRVGPTSSAAGSAASDAGAGPLVGCLPRRRLTLTPP
jgi:hypothetical protein